MSKTLKLVKASVGSYTDKDGKTKQRYRVIGKVIDLGNGGQMLAIDLTLAAFICQAHGKAS